MKSIFSGLIALNLLLSCVDISSSFPRPYRSTSFLAPVTLAVSDPKGLKLIKEKIKKIVEKTLRGESLNLDDRFLSPFRLKIRARSLRVRLGSLKIGEKNKAIYIERVKGFKKGMEVEFWPRFDTKGVLFFELYEVVRTGEMEVLEKLGQNPRLDLEKGGFFDIHWAERSQTEIEGKRGLKRVLGVVLKKILNETLSDKDREEFSFKVKVNNDGGILFGYVPQESKYPIFFRKNKVRIKSPAILKKGMEVQVNVRFDSKGELFLEIVEVVQEEKEEGLLPKVLCTPRYSFEASGFFDESWKEGLLSPREGRRRVKDIVLRLLQEKPMPFEYKKTGRFRVEVSNSTGRVVFGTTPRGFIGSGYREIKFSSKAYFKKGMTLELFPKFDSEEVLYFEVYSVEKEGEREVLKRLPVLPRFNRGKSSFFDLNGEPIFYKGAQKVCEIASKYLREEPLSVEDQRMKPFEEVVTSANGDFDFGSFFDDSRIKRRYSMKRLYLRPREKQGFRWGDRMKVSPFFTLEGDLYLKVEILERLRDQKGKGQSFIYRFNPDVPGFFSLINSSSPTALKKGIPEFDKSVRMVASSL